MGKVEGRHSGGGRGRKRGLPRNLGVAWERLLSIVKMLSTIRKRAPQMGWEVMWKTRVAEEDVVGKH